MQWRLKQQQQQQQHERNDQWTKSDSCPPKLRVKRLMQAIRLQTRPLQYALQKYYVNCS